MGYYAEGRLLYAGRTRNGFTPSLRAGLMKRFDGLETSECPFTNLPESNLLVPQSRFLEFITGEAAKYPSFRLVMRANDYWGHSGWH